MRLEGLLASVTTQGNTICRQPSVWLWTANRTAESRACSHVGCGGTMETKFQHIGQCRKPSMAQMRARFAAKYGIPTTGGTFLDRQVIEMRLSGPCTAPMLDRPHVWIGFAQGTACGAMHGAVQRTSPAGSVVRVVCYYVLCVSKNVAGATVTRLLELSFSCTPR